MEYRSNLQKVIPTRKSGDVSYLLIHFQRIRAIIFAFLTRGTLRWSGRPLCWGINILYHIEKVLVSSVCPGACLNRSTVPNRLSKWSLSCGQ
jgi:hypothetical protein